MKILILKFRNIGDVLLATPLVNNLSQIYPDAIIDFAINKNCQEMLADHPDLNHIYLYDRDKIKKLGLFQKLKQELAFIRDLAKNNYDMVINLTEGDRGALIALFSGAKQRIGILPKTSLAKFVRFYTLYIDKIPFEHTVNKDLFPLELLEQKPLTKNVSIYWPETVDIKIQQLLHEQKISQFIHIHPVARWFFKCWDNQKFADLIDYCQSDLGKTVILTASPDPDELARVQSIVKLCQTIPVNFSGQLNLKEVACLSSKAELFIGVDTAPMHMAAAVNTPVIALFGNSFAYIWGPWDNQLMQANYENKMANQRNGIHQIIQKDGDDDIVYIDNEKLSTAMMRIDVDDVKALVTNHYA